MRFLKQLILLALAVGACFVAWIAWFALTPMSLRTETLEFTIPQGISLRQTSHMLSEAGAGFSPWQFAFLGRLMGRATDIKAGSYDIGAGITPFQLLAKLAHGDVSMGEIVFVEGKTFADVRAAMAAHPLLKHDSNQLSESEILRRIGASESHLEGLMFPDTYWFAKNGSDIELLRHSYRLMQIRLLREWEGRDPALPYQTPYEALIMASIVEKETGQAGDRMAIAGVFVNRLRRGMLLQTDPSVIYGLGNGFDGNLRKRDLKTDTPYNTYTRSGLPPTPIAMSSLASVQAALHPTKGDMLYFVSRGDGSSQFSRTLDEHNRAVSRYQLHRGG
jgi:UPF0755 protein